MWEHSCPQWSFQYKKIYESDPDAVRHETVNTLYPHINNDIEYDLFEDVINSYYLDSQIKYDFNCNQKGYTDIQQTQHEQQLTSCTHVFSLRDKIGTCLQRLQRKQKN